MAGLQTLVAVEAALEALNVVDARGVPAIVVTPRSPACWSCSSLRDRYEDVVRLFDFPKFSSSRSRCSRCRRGCDVRSLGRKLRSDQP